VRAVYESNRIAIVSDCDLHETSLETEKTMKNFFNLKQLLISLTILSQFAFIDSASAQFGLEFIEVPTESPEAIEKALAKEKPKLDLVTASQKAEILSGMCKIELMSSAVKANLIYCGQYATFYQENQPAYTEPEKLASAKQFCLTMPNHREQYRLLDREILKVALNACQKAISDDSPTNSAGFSSELAGILRNYDRLSRILKEYSQAQSLYTDLLVKSRKRLSETKGENEKYEKENILLNEIYPTLTFLGDLYFATEDYDRAISFYLEADKIYQDQVENHQAFISSSKINGSLYLDDESFLRANSFIGSRARLAYALVKQGKLDAAEKYLTDAITALENASDRQQDNSNATALQEVGSLLYTTQQSLLINQKKYAQALELADRSRSFVYSRSFQSSGEEYDEKDLTFSKMQALAKEQNATFVVYTIPDLIQYDYQAFTGQQNRVFIWVIQPNGELHFQDVNVSSMLSQSNSKSQFIATLTTAQYPASFLVVGIGIAILLYLCLPNKKKTLVGLIGIIVTALAIQSCNNFSPNSGLQQQPPSSKGNSLSSLTKTTLSKIGSRGQGDSPLSEQACQENQDCLQSLYKVLIEPIANVLPNNPEDRVIFVPHRGLHRVPFAALKDPNGKYLIESHTIQMSPSLQTFQTLLERAANRVISSDKYLFVGNPIMPKVSFGQLGEPEAISQLPGTELEVREIAKLYGTKPLIGKDASVDVVESRLSDSKVIHLATHAFLDVGSERESALVLTPGSSESGQENGILGTGTLYSHRPVAEIAVLSACDTGLGLETVEGNLGLTRPFLVNGVPTVISSIWSVPDESTGELMIDFYKNLQTTSDKAKALRQAMLTTMKKYPDPVHWAGFMLTGLAELPKPSKSARTVVGRRFCYTVDRGDLNQNANDLDSATLKSSPSGFILSLNETDATDGWHLNEQLVVQDEGLANGTKVEIKPDGSFIIRGMPVSGRHYCSFEGKLEFIGDAANKLKRSR
jgi:CHAT domain-containing protein